MVPLSNLLSLPTAAALGASGLVAVAPIQLLLLARFSSRQPELWPWAAVAYRRRLSWPRTVAWAGVLFLLAAAAFLLTAPLARKVKAVVFGWWPTDWLVDLGTKDRFSPSHLLITALI